MTTRSSLRSDGQPGDVLDRLDRVGRRAGRCRRAPARGRAPPRAAPRPAARASRSSGSRARAAPRCPPTSTPGQLRDPLLERGRCWRRARRASRAPGCDDAAQRLLALAELAEHGRGVGDEAGDLVLLAAQRVGQVAQLGDRARELAHRRVELRARPLGVASPRSSVSMIELDVAAPVARRGSRTPRRSRRSAAPARCAPGLELGLALRCPGRGRGRGRRAACARRSSPRRRRAPARARRRR